MIRSDTIAAAEQAYKTDDSNVIQGQEVPKTSLVDEWVASLDFDTLDSSIPFIHTHYFYMAVSTMS